MKNLKEKKEIIYSESNRLFPNIHFPKNYSDKEKKLLVKMLKKEKLLFLLVMHFFSFM